MRRARGRSLLVVVMIALPVLGVTAADVALETLDVDSAESVERRLGSADARLSVNEGTRRVWQTPDPDHGQMTAGRFRDGLPDLSDAARILGREVRGIAWRDGGRAKVRTDKGVAQVDTVAIDLADPLAVGLFDLEAGRFPAGRGEVVVNGALAERGVAVGDAVEVGRGSTYEVVGVGEATDFFGYPRMFGPDPRWASRSTASNAWLVAAGPVTWPEVQALNEAGFTVTSRAVLLDPPPDAEVPTEVRTGSSGPDPATVAVVLLVVVMALIEVVLLAGPAFAVGARRQTRSLALLAATGATPGQLRRVVLAAAVVLGGIGAVLGVVLGLVVARLALPVLQSYSGSWFGPYDVPWPHLLVIAGFGLASAVLAAVVPAWIASRQDVVAVLAGRRGDRRPSLRSPALGLVLLVAGVAAAAIGTRPVPMREVLIAGSAVLAVLGMVLLVPVVVAVVAAGARRLPLALRYAARDAARHRTRTTPAVAAVAATVAGVVALGIATASDAEQDRATYRPLLTEGMGAVMSGPMPERRYAEVVDAVAEQVPGHDVTAVRGVEHALPGEAWRDVRLRAPGGGPVLTTWSTITTTDALVGEEALRLLSVALSEAELGRVEAALAEGLVVLFTDRTDLLDADSVRLGTQIQAGRGPARPELRPVWLDAVYVQVAADSPIGRAVIPDVVVEELGLPTATAGVVVDGPISVPEEQDVEEAIAAVRKQAGFYVERGFQNDDDTLVALLVLGGLGALLVVGGTLTATFLSLADARPDLATLSAVGAAPRTRRAVAAAYALVVGLVGAVLGALVGAVPGVAITYPLTATTWGAGTDGGPGHHLDVPWLLVAGLVLVLPLLTAALVAGTARSRLPVVARLD